jgi:hypothetical protein
MEFVTAAKSVMSQAPRVSTEVHMFMILLKNGKFSSENSETMRKCKKCFKK